VLAAANLAPAMAQAPKPASQVVEWNRTLLVIVRTPGAQPATIHPTRSFAIMHSAIYDAVNAIDGTHKPYLIRLSASHFASQEAAAVGAAHEVLVNLYPKFSGNARYPISAAAGATSEWRKGRGYQNRKDRRRSNPSSTSQ